MLEIILILLTSMFSAAREIINLQWTPEPNIPFYTWVMSERFNLDAFHVYPAISLILSLVFVILPATNPWITISIFLFVFYQIRNYFLHVILPVRENIPKKLTIPQFIALIAALIIFSIFLIFQYAV